jgi:3-oxoacyl-[acyl-carrier-protein] synthase-3
VGNEAGARAATPSPPAPPPVPAGRAAGAADGQPEPNDRSGWCGGWGGVWLDFEARLPRGAGGWPSWRPGRFTLDDYKELLVNLRQHGRRGARWIDRPRRLAGGHRSLPGALAVHSRHAGDEHRDFRLLERDYVSVGGALEEITGADKNIGSEALSAWMFHRAGQPNPLDLLGAMFIIEGLGARLAHRWGTLVREQLGLEGAAGFVLLYHGGNDDSHLGQAGGGGRLGPDRRRAPDRMVKPAR